MSIELQENSPKTDGQMSQQETPKRKAGLDYMTVGVELYNYYAIKKEKPDWDAIATKVGSASGKSVHLNWHKFCKKHEGTPTASPGKGRGRGRKKITDDVLKRSPMKVTKNTTKTTGGKQKKGKRDTLVAKISDEDHATSVKLESGSGEEDSAEDLVEDPE